MATRLDAELIGGILPHHSGDQRLWHIRIMRSFRKCHPKKGHHAGGSEDHVLRLDRGAVRLLTRTSMR
jgi:hypothetical protein